MTRQPFRSAHLLAALLVARSPHRLRLPLLPHRHHHRKPHRRAHPASRGRLPQRQLRRRSHSPPAPSSTIDSRSAAAARSRSRTPPPTDKQVQITGPTLGRAPAGPAANRASARRQSRIPSSAHSAFLTPRACHRALRSGNVRSIQTTLPPDVALNPSDKTLAGGWSCAPMLHPDATRLLIALCESMASPCAWQDASSPSALATVFVGLAPEANLIWVANGVMLAYLLLAPRNRWPAYLGRRLRRAIHRRLARRSSRHRRADSFSTLLNLAEALISALLLRRRSSDLPDFTNPAYITRFFAFGVFAGPSIIGSAPITALLARRFGTLDPALARASSPGSRVPAMGRRRRSRSLRRHSGLRRHLSHSFSQFALLSQTLGPPASGCRLSPYLIFSRLHNASGLHSLSRS